MKQLNQSTQQTAIPEDIVKEAEELARQAEILPDGVQGLAKRIHEARLNGKQLRVKLGVDPTSTDLHVGHAVVFRKLRRFQDFGHQVVLIIGGFTAQIGDPTGRNSTRPPLGAEQVAANAQTYLDQMGVILDLSKTEVVNNADWLAKMSLNEILKLAGSVTANQLLAKEAFGNRLEKQLPVGFHELFYPLLQGYDSVAIRSDIELGGTDQRFNILQGRELQPHYGQPAQMALLLPLLEGTDGVQKMSKSYGNYIGLKDEPSEMFGKCMRIPDELIVKYFELATTCSGAEIDAIKSKLEAGSNPKEAKEQLAQAVVALYHGQQAAEKALEEWHRVHSQRQIPDDIAQFKLKEKTFLFRLLVDAKLVASGAEAKRLIQEGAVRINGDQVKEPNFELQPSTCAGHVIQVGRRKFVRLES